MNNITKTLLGFDIGGTKCAVLVGTYDGLSIEIIAKESIPTGKNESPYSITEQLCVLAEGLLEGKDVDAIGISCGGPLDSKKGIVMRPPNLPLWDDFPICEILTKRFNAPAHLQNDANACALAEFKLGAGQGTNNMVFLTFGTGLGAGIIINGMLYEGTNGNAGEVGHIRLADKGPVGFGKAGSFEGFCSGGGIAQLGYIDACEAINKGAVIPYFDAAKPYGGLSAKILAEQAHLGDEFALNTYKKCGHYLGKGLSILIDILNPECIVIGSIFARSGELLISEMEKEIKQEALPCSSSVCNIVPAMLGEQIGDYAALITATL